MSPLALIVVANPGAQSFSHAMADTVDGLLTSLGYSVARHDLYAERFDPVQPTSEAGNTVSTDALVEQHCAELGQADLILLFHPNWWGQPPAILKGWIDRVFRLNTAYGYPAGVGFEGAPVGLLKAAEALVFNTSNTPAGREAEVFGDPLEAIWRKCVFDLCGVSKVTRRMYGPIAGSSELQRAAWLREVYALVQQAALRANGRSGQRPLPAHDTVPATHDTVPTHDIVPLVPGAERGRATSPRASSSASPSSAATAPVFRRAAAEDAPVLGALASQIFYDTYATRGIDIQLVREAAQVYSTQAFASRLRDSAAEITVVESEGGLIAFLEMTFGDSCPVPTMTGPEVRRLYVQAPFQRCGIGRQLMARAERTALDRQATHLWLTAWTGNSRAIAFYRAMGFEDIGTTQYVCEEAVYENRVFAKRLSIPPR